MLLLVVCWRRVFDSKTTDTPDKLKAAIDCAPCTVFRVLLFACIGIGLLLMAGQGVTATERIGTSLGLIEARVNEIHGDTTVIRETLSGMELVKNPESAQEYFHNAWVLNMQRGDSAGAWQQLQALYHRHTPNKLDAADMYLTVGKSQLARPALQAQMVEIGRSRRDAAMLVVAARNAETPEAARALREEAQVIESIQALVDKGTKVLVCGTCLNYYGLAERLKVGVVSTMYDILGAMQRADKVISL